MPMIPDQLRVDPPKAVRFAKLLAACLLWMLVVTPTSWAQDEPIVINSEGGNTGFLDDDDPSRVILVFFGGVDVAMGNRRLQGETVVAVLQRGNGEEKDSKMGAEQSILPDSRVIELFVDGNLDRATFRQIVVNSLGKQSWKPSTD